MILAQVREDEHGEADVEEPLLLGAVRGRLEGGAEIAGVEHLAERPLQVDRLGRRANRRPALAADAAFDRPQQPGLASRGLEDRVEQERRRRLAVRPRDGGDLELLRRPPEELGGGTGHRLAHVRDHDLRYPGRDGVCHDERSGAVLYRSRGIFVPVRALARHAEEEGPRSHRAAVVGEVGDLDGRFANDLDGCEGV